jgi:hypothetical protein
VTLQVVIVVPALLLAISLVFQAMVFYRARQGAESAARQAVDAARLARSAPGDGTAEADDVLAQLGHPLDAPHVVVSRQGAAVVATVSGRSPMIVPGLALHVSATAQAPTERFVP